MNATKRNYNKIQVRNHKMRLLKGEEKMKKNNGKDPIQKFKEDYNKLIKKHKLGLFPQLKYTNVGIMVELQIRSIKDDNKS